MTIGENLSIELDTGLLNRPGLAGLLKILVKVFGQRNVVEHGSQLVHSVVTAFNLQLLEHELLSFFGERGFVQQSRGQMLSV